MAPMSSPVDLQCSHCAALLHDDTTREILAELDRERTRRAEIEAELRELKEEQAKENEETITLSRKHFAALQTELKGYRDLIDVMTRERPAIEAALKANTRLRLVPGSFDIPKLQKTATLPLHVIRLLEIMPWDPRAKEYAFAKEEVFEWQFWDKRHKTWKNELRHSPRAFRELPLEEPKATAGINGTSEGSGSSASRSFFHESAPPSSAVMTNHRMTKLYDLQKGYPLPENGATYEWVGSWRVEKRISLNDEISPEQSTNGNNRRIDCDDEGWSYTTEATHFLEDNPSQHCWDTPGKEDSIITRPVRRRKWTRQRALIDYPHASEQTKAFLSIMAQRMYANMAANKISEQLVSTKVALTTVESVLLHCKDDASRQENMLSELMLAKSKSKISTSEDAKAIVVAVSDKAKQMQQEIEQALQSTRRDNNSNGLP